MSPGFPASGGDHAPLVIEADGRIDLEYQGYHITNDVTYTMTPAHSYFTSSDDGGRTWSTPVQVGPDRLTMSKAEWWIDGAIGMNSGGNLYITWDTQDHGRDIGWLAYSTDHGKQWYALQRVTPDDDNATHIVEVAGGSAGIAYVGWLADNAAGGYAEYLRTFSVARGWLSVRCGSRTGSVTGRSGQAIPSGSPSSRGRGASAGAARQLARGELGKCSRRSTPSEVSHLRGRRFDSLKV